MILIGHFLFHLSEDVNIIKLNLNIHNSKNIRKDAKGFKKYI